MDIESFTEEWDALLHPEPDDDGLMPHEYPVDRLKTCHGLNFDYFEQDFTWEGSSVHRYTRHCPADQERVHVLTRNQDVPERLFESALQLFSDSLRLRATEKKREGELRYYPPVVLTFWSGFETYVRRASELLIATTMGIPEPVSNYLQEKEIYVTPSGQIKERVRFQSVLDRYALLLQYGYNWSPDKGSRFWQQLVAAKNLRDYYTHLDITEPRSITSAEVLAFMESVLLGMIWPSSQLQRTLMLGLFRLYEQWNFLNNAHELYTERPFFLNWKTEREYLFHCNFENINEALFPNMEQRVMKNRRTKKQE